MVSASMDPSPRFDRYIRYVRYIAPGALHAGMEASAGTQGHHFERSCGAYGSILLVPRHRHFIPDPNGCLKCSPRKNSTVGHLQVKATCLPTHTVTHSETKSRRCRIWSW